MSRPYPGYPSPGMLSGRECARIDNAIQPRAVIGWRLTGSAYQRGRRIPGAVYLDLEGGGWIWYPESTTLPAALADADAQGYQTVEVRARLDHWVATGEGARFTLEDPK